MLVFACLVVNGEDLPILKVPTKPTIPDSGTISTTPTLTTPTLPDITLPEIKDPSTELEVFTAPSELKTIKTEYNLVSLQWDDNTTTETNFIIERKTQKSEYSQLAALGTNITEYEDTSVEPKTTYYYRVKAGKSGSDITARGIVSTYSSYSNEIMVATPAAPSLPFERPGLDIGEKLPGDILLPIRRIPPE